MKQMIFAKAAAIVLAGTIALTLAPVAMVADAQAQGAPTQIKQNNAWGAYKHSGANGTVCYILSIPTEMTPKEIEGRAVDHGDVFFMISQQPGQNVRLEPQFTAGYPFQDNSKVVVDIDGKQFSMFTRGQNAWLENPAEEPAIISAMRAGRSMKVNAVSRRGTQTSYSYSLAGVTASISDIQNCK